MSKNFRSFIDVTPWDTDGYSFWGLKRHQAKALGLVFIVTGFLFADPPFSILPTDILNIWLAGVFASFFNISMELALLFTYTIWAWGLILIGTYIYPYDSQRLLNGYMNKIKRVISKALKNPIYLLIGLGIFYFIFNWYKKMLATNPAPDAVCTFCSSFVTKPTELTTLFVLGIIIFIIVLIRGKK